MKSVFKLSCFVILAIIIVASCSPKYYYQIGEIKPIDKNVQFNENNELIYVDNNISITYSFWGKYGEIYFIISNLSEENITIHLDNSFFIRNGIAYDYFQNRTYTQSSSNAEFQTFFTNYIISYGKSFSSSSSNSILYEEVPQIIIPKKSSKIMYQFNITDYIYRSCDLYLWQNTLSSTQINQSILSNTKTLEEDSLKTMTDAKGKILNKVFFDTINSPYLFENRITYSISNSEEKIEVSNKFYVASIQNCSENKVKKYDYQKNCNDDSFEEQVLINLVYAPNKYYIKYSTSDFNSTVKH